MSRDGEVTYLIYSFHQIVRNMPVEVIEKQLNCQPHVVHDIDSSGRRPLHEACVRGDRLVVRLLLQSDADANAVDVKGETPLHVACRHNHLAVVHELSLWGVRFDAVDMAGRNALHHAALGNSVLVAHFLREVHGFECRARDCEQRTPLHIVCSLGHIDGFHYFVNLQRSNPLDRDIYGNTALHLAAMYGQTWHCLELVKRYGSHLLFILNNDLRSAADMAKQGLPYKHRRLARKLSMLRISANQQSTDVVRGPVKMWYALVLMPWVVPLIVVSLGLFCDANADAYVVLAGAIWLGTFDLMCGHRMNHITNLVAFIATMAGAIVVHRWPNPAHASNFSAGFIYSIISYYVFIFQDVCDEFSDSFVWFTVTWTAVLVVMYGALMILDPGVCKDSPKSSSSCREYSIVDVAAGINMEFCIRCELVKPAGTEHCRLCNRCYRYRNHHCVYLYRCIAANNCYLFFAYAIASVIAMVLFEAVVIWYVVLHYRPPTSSTSEGVVIYVVQLAVDAFFKHPYVWPLFLLNGLSLCWLALILSEVVVAVARNLDIPCPCLE